jgi:hypothetical protein
MLPQPPRLNWLLISLYSTLKLLPILIAGHRGADRMQ